MKRLITLFVLLLLTLSAGAQTTNTNILYGYVTDYGLNSLSNINVSLTLQYPKNRTVANYILRNDEVGVTSGAGGYFAFTNIQWGRYLMSVSGQLGTPYTVNVGTNTSGSTPIASLISSVATNIPNPASNYFTQSQTLALISGIATGSGSPSFTTPTEIQFIGTGSNYNTLNISAQDNAGGYAAIRFTTSNTISHVLSEYAAFGISTLYSPFYSTTPFQPNFAYFETDNQSGIGWVANGNTLAYVEPGLGQFHITLAGGNTDAMYVNRNNGNGGIVGNWSASNFIGSGMGLTGITGFVPTNAANNYIYFTNFFAVIDTNGNRRFETDSGGVNMWSPQGSNGVKVSPGRVDIYQPGNGLAESLAIVSNLVYATVPIVGTFLDTGGTNNNATNLIGIVPTNTLPPSVVFTNGPNQTFYQSPRFTNGLHISDLVSLIFDAVGPGGAFIQNNMNHSGGGSGGIESELGISSQGSIAIQGGLDAQSAADIQLGGSGAYHEAFHVQYDFVPSAGTNYDPVAALWGYSKPFLFSASAGNGSSTVNGFNQGFRAEVPTNNSIPILRYYSEFGTPSGWHQTVLNNQTGYSPGFLSSNSVTWTSFIASNSFSGSNIFATNETVSNLTVLTTATYGAPSIIFKSGTGTATNITIGQRDADTLTVSYWHGGTDYPLIELGARNGGEFALNDLNGNIAVNVALRQLDGNWITGPLFTAGAANALSVTGTNSVTTSNLFATNQIVVGAITNTASFTAVFTNFIDGGINTNSTGRNIFAYSQCTVTPGTGTGGNATYALRVGGVTKSSLSIGTLATSLAMPQTNFVCYLITNSATFAFTNLSTGTGSTAAILPGGYYEVH